MVSPGHYVVSPPNQSIASSNVQVNQPVVVVEPKTNAAPQPINLKATVPAEPKKVEYCPPVQICPPVQPPPTQIHPNVNVNPVPQPIPL